MENYEGLLHLDSNVIDSRVDNLLSKFVNYTSSQFRYTDSNYEVGLTELHIPYTWYNVSYNQMIGVFTSDTKQLVGLARIDAGFYPNIDDLLRHCNHRLEFSFFKRPGIGIQGQETTLALTPNSNRVYASLKTISGNNRFRGIHLRFTPQLATLLGFSNHSFLAIDATHLRGPDRTPQKLNPLPYRPRKGRIERDAGESLDEDEEDIDEEEDRKEEEEFKKDEEAERKEAEQERKEDEEERKEEEEEKRVEAEEEEDEYVEEQQERYRSHWRELDFLDERTNREIQKTIKRRPDLEATNVFPAKGKIEYLGEHGQYIHGSFRVVVLDTPGTQGEDPNVATSPPLVRAGIDELFVYCSIVKHSALGNQFKQILRITPVYPPPHKQRGEPIVLSYEKPFYFPLYDTCFDRIEVQLRDRQGNLIDFQSGSVLAILDIRRNGSDL